MEKKWMLIIGSKLDELNFAAILDRKGIATTGRHLISSIDCESNDLLASELEWQGFVVRKANPEEIVNDRVISHRVYLPDSVERKHWWLKPKLIR